MADFVKKVAVVALFVVLLLLLYNTLSILLMILAAVIVALYFHGLAGLIKRKTGISHTWSMGLSYLITFVILGAIFWLIGAQLQQQISELTEQIPKMIDEAKSKLQESAIGSRILEQLSGDNAGKYMSSVKKFFGSTFGALGDIYIILFLSIFFTAEPSIYVKGILALVPSQNKDRASEILTTIGSKLMSWLKGRIIAMIFIGVITGIGLVIIGMPMVLALAFIAAIFNFIPNFGPLIALIPAVLVGLTMDGTTVLLVIGIYTLAQVLESNIINPTVQRKLVDIPPALIITGQLMIGSITGYLGLLLATPVVLIIMVLVNQLYVVKN